jgi:nitrite reductase (NADH) large subunit
VTARRLAIIGNGMATGRLLDELIRRAPDAYEIHVFGEEPHGCYNRILLGRILAGGERDEIMLKPVPWYADRGVRYHSGATVTKLDAGTRVLECSDGTTHAFDVTVLATGSVPVVPNVKGLRDAEGNRKKGVFAFRTIEDCERIRESVSPASNAVVVGGGLLGLEAAKALGDLGMHVTVVQREPHLMNTQVDAPAGALLKQSVEQLGIWVRTGVEFNEILGEDRVAGVGLASGERLPADLVVFACGIRPRVDLAQASGVPVKRGIVVNDVLATSLAGVYAIGECAEHAGKVYGIVQPIFEQCAVLADVLTAANPKARYRGSKLYTRLKVAGIEVASMGLVEPEFDTDEVLQVTEARRGIYRKLIVRDGRLVGAVLVGDTSASPALVRLFDRGDPLPANRLDVLASGDGAGAISSASDPEICNCHHVDQSSIVAAIRGGCSTLSALSNQTKAGTGCGSCRGKLTDLIYKNAPVVAGRGKD